jgi:hypothetical protein
MHYFDGVIGALSGGLRKIEYFMFAVVPSQ